MLWNSFRTPLSLMGQIQELPGRHSASEQTLANISSIPAAPTEWVRAVISSPLLPNDTSATEWVGVADAVVCVVCAATDMPVSARTCWCARLHVSWPVIGGKVHCEKTQETIQINCRTPVHGDLKLSLLLPGELFPHPHDNIHFLPL